MVYFHSLRLPWFARAKDANRLTTKTFVKMIVETPNAISCVCKFRKILHLEKWAKHGEMTVINI